MHLHTEFASMRVARVCDAVTKLLGVSPSSPQPVGGVFTHPDRVNEPGAYTTRLWSQ